MEPHYYTVATNIETVGSCMQSYPTILYKEYMRSLLAVYMKVIELTKRIQISLYSNDSVK